MVFLPTDIKFQHLPLLFFHLLVGFLGRLGVGLGGGAGRPGSRHPSTAAWSSDAAILFLESNMTFLRKSLLGVGVLI